jgi:hypothetical protein
MLRNMRARLAALLLLLAMGGCGGDGGERFAVYHLESSIGEPADEGELRCGPPRTVCPGVVVQPPPETVHYDVHATPALTGDDIDRGTLRRATDTLTGAPIVVVSLTPDGREALARLTREVAREGARDQRWHHVAIVVGDEIVSFLEVDFDSHPDGFPDATELQITAVDDADAGELIVRLRGD